MVLAIVFRSRGSDMTHNLVALVDCGDGLIPNATALHDQWLESNPEPDGDYQFAEWLEAQGFNVLNHTTAMVDV